MTTSAFKVLQHFLVGSLLLGCAGDPSQSASTPTPTPENGTKRQAPELGTGDHTASSVTLTPIAKDVVSGSAMAFNPAAPNELWVVERDIDTLVVYDVSQDPPKKVDTFADDSDHFLTRVISLSFGEGVIATCQDSRDERNKVGSTGDDHMGPSVISASRETLRKGGIGATHLDMVHHTPLCMGITWTGAGNEYWIFNGLAGALDRYQFGKWHKPGADNHSDSTTWRFLPGEFKRVANVPSELAYDAESKTLYVADTGNARIVALDVANPQQGSVITPGNSMDGPLYAGSGIAARAIVAADSGLVSQPSGLLLKNGLLYVTDNATSVVSAFSATTGERVNYLETGLAPGSLTGIAIGPDDAKIYLADKTGKQVLRIDPKATSK